MLHMRISRPWGLFFKKCIYLLPQLYIYDLSIIYLFFDYHSMQLFITDFKIQNNQVLIQDCELIQQIRKVLRLGVGDSFFLQKVENEFILRYKTQIKVWDNKEIFCDILDKQERPLGHLESKKTIVVAMPNKRQKAELIVQKLSEIGIQHIYFRPGERSIIKEKNINKRERIKKISQEATEQSWNRILPKVGFLTDISKLIADTAVTVFDIQVKWATPNNKWNQDKEQVVVIGPEGWLTAADYKKFGKSFRIMNLGEWVLRTETAAIVGGRLLKNQF